MNRLFRVASLLLLTVAIPTYAYDLSVSQTEARDSFVEMLKDPALNSGDSDTADQLVRMIRSYRERSVPKTSTIEEASFVGYILQNQIVGGWQDLYQQQYQDQYVKYVKDINYEGLLDVLMQAVIADQLPPDMKSTGGQVGSCLAKKIEAASNDSSCALDVSDAIPKPPSRLSLGFMKLTCNIPILTWFTSNCSARRAVYDYAKPQLIQAKKQNVMATVFPQIFPQQFRKELLQGAEEKRRDIAKFISGKFKASVDTDLWTSAPLIDVENSRTRISSLHEFSSGLSADIRAASVLQNSAPEIAAPLFYAAANRLVTMMGGLEATWDPNKGGGIFVPAPGNQFDPGNPTASPKFITDSFGGIGAVQPGQPSAWDISKYDPTATSNPTPLRLFPSRFVIGARDTVTPVSGEAATETLGDLGELMGALVDFLELTGPRSALASHFAPSTDFGRIISDTDPAVFPREGRALAVGLIAAEVKNMVAPQGHLILPDLNGPMAPPQDDHSGIFGLRFYDVIDLSGREEGKVPTSAIAKLFGAAARLGGLVTTADPDIPQAMVEFRPTIDKAVELAMYSMIARCQKPDGGFTETLGGDPDYRSLQTQVAVLKTLTEVYDQTHTPALRLSIREAWKFMDQFWSNEAEIPRPSVGKTDMIAKVQSPSALWHLMGLWNKTLSTAIFPDLMNPLLDDQWGANGWDRWRVRFDALHKRLTDQLDTSNGPNVIAIDP